MSKNVLSQQIINSIVNEVDERFDESISFLKDMVHIETENPNLCKAKPGKEAELQKYIADYLQKNGFHVDIFGDDKSRPNLLGNLKGDGNGRSLILNGHIDVVPTGDSLHWKYDPWSGKIDDGMMYGRGTVDMKGGIAAMIAAVEAVRRAGYKLKGDLFINTVIDEENGGGGTKATLESGLKADAVIIPEPTNLNIYVVEGGLEWLRLSTSGVAGHTAMRYESIHAGGKGNKINAIEKMMKILNGVMELERYWAIHKTHPLMPKGITTINIGVILGGVGRDKDGIPTALNSPSTFPDYCTALLSLKYLPNENTKFVRTEFEDYINRIAQSDFWLRDNPPKIEWGANGVSIPPVNTSLDHPLIQSISNAHKNVVGEPKYSGYVGKSDLAWFTAKGIPGCLYGPGPLSTAHTSTECLSIIDFNMCIKTLALTIAEWCCI